MLHFTWWKSFSRGKRARLREHITGGHIVIQEDQHLSLSVQRHIRETRHCNLHPVEAAALGEACRVFSLEVVRDIDVKVTLVLVIGTVLKLAGNSLRLLNGENITQVEDSLFPVGVLGVGTSGKADWLVAGAELNVEPGNQGVNEVGALRNQTVRNTECEIGRGNSIQVECDDRARVGDQGLHLHSVDQRLGESDLLHRTVVKAVDIVPD